MDPGQRSGSPRGRQHRDRPDERPPTSQDWAYDQSNESYRSRHGYSRSPPPRNDLPYDDLPEEDPRHRETMVWRQYERTDDGDGGYYDRTSRSGGDHTQRRDRRPEPGEEYHHGRHDRPNRSQNRSRGRYDYDDPQYGSQRHYHGRGSESYSDHERNGRPRSRGQSRSYSRSPARHPGSPSDTVLLEGLPSDVSVNELQSCVISSSVLSSEDFVDIRIPPTGGQRRAFVQFHDVSDASKFVDKHFPELTIELPPREGAVDGTISLYVHFARSRDDGDRKYLSGGQWECPSCDFSNFATRARCKMCGWAQSSAAPGYQQALTGETDASNDASQFLVVYPLDACVTEEVLEFGMKKLEVVEKQRVSKDSGVPAKPLKSTAPTGDATGYGARRGSLHRVFLIRDKSSGQTLKYGFAEFWTLEDAMAALTKFRKSRSFTIGGTPVTIFSIHMGVFVPDLQPPTAEDDKFSFVPLFNPALRVKYWDPRVYASQRIVNSEPPKKLESTEEGSNNTSDGKKAKKRKADGSLGSAAAKKPVAMAGQMAMWQKKSQELHSGRAATTPDHGQDSEETRSRSPAAIPANDGPIKITLGGMAKAAAKPELPDRAAPRPTASEQPSATNPTADAPISFVDRERVCCLLCMMKYKSADDLNTHERSGNHKKAMADEEKVKAAMPRLAARDKRAQEKAKSEEEKPQYRDRAKERREVFNQPNKPAPPTSKAKSGGGKAEAARKPDVAKKPDAEAAPKPSKGSAMLAKMGWTGQGLGANGEGRTEAIAANLYQQGVGLGVEGGNLGDAGEVAARKTEGGYKGYVTSVQEKARERYNKLGEQGGA